MDNFRFGPNPAEDARIAAEEGERLAAEVRRVDPKDFEICQCDRLRKSCPKHAAEWQAEHGSAPTAGADVATLERVLAKLRETRCGAADLLTVETMLAETRAAAQPSDPAHPHLIGGEFQSDKYPTCPRGKVPLSTKDATAQDLLWEYAQRHRTIDAQFSDDLEAALEAKGFEAAIGAFPTTRDAALLEVGPLGGDEWVGSGSDSPHEWRLERALENALRRVRSGQRFATELDTTQRQHASLREQYDELVKAFEQCCSAANIPASNDQEERLHAWILEVSAGGEKLLEDADTARKERDEANRKLELDKETFRAASDELDAERRAREEAVALADRYVDAIAKESYEMGLVATMTPEQRVRAMRVTANLLKTDRDEQKARAEKAEADLALAKEDAKREYFNAWCRCGARSMPGEGECHACWMRRPAGAPRPGSDLRLDLAKAIANRPNDTQLTHLLTEVKAALFELEKRAELKVGAKAPTAPPAQLPAWLSHMAIVRAPLDIPADVFRSWCASEATSEQRATAWLLAEFELARRAIERLEAKR
ncbi:MAG: hypothetical protein HOW73_20200 [Polyangiaceae bacterium]|nr:hypothetical protein [Polyangiaceae bacterium]